MLKIRGLITTYKDDFATLSANWRYDTATNSNPLADGSSTTASAGWVDLSTYNSNPKITTWKPRYS